MNLTNRRDFLKLAATASAAAAAGKAKPLYADSQEVLGGYGHGERQALRSFNRFNRRRNGKHGRPCLLLAFVFNPAGSTRR